LLDVHAVKKLPAGLTSITTVYGDTRIVSAADLANPKRTQLPLYTTTGKKISDHYHRMNWPSKALFATIHRENIVP
jgi:hypothetical protein